MIEIIPTYVPRDAEDLRRGAQVIRTFASAIHVDVDDGVFAPYITWPYSAAGVFRAVDLSALGGFSIEVHLMVEEPRELGIAFVRAGASRIIGHIEGFADTNEAHGALDAWRHAGASEVGLAILFDTPFPVLDLLISACDCVHIMSIATIGTQGIPYDPRAPARIAEFHALHPELPISVDGGVSEANIGELVRAGASRFGVGASIAKSDNPKAAYEKLKMLAENAIQ